MRSFALCLLLTVVCGGAARGQAGFDPWLNGRINDVVAARIGAKDPAKTPAPVAASGAQAPLVDRGAVPDVAGISIRLPSQSPSGGLLPTTAAFAGNPLALIFGLLESGLIDPSSYLRNRAHRRLGLNVTFDVDGENRGRTLVQARYLIRDRGNVLANDTRVSAALNNSTDAYGRLSAKVREILWERVGRTRFADDAQGQIQFRNSLANDAVLQGALRAAGESGMGEIDGAIRAELESFAVLRRVIDEATEAARARPLLAIGLTSELSEGAARQVRAGGIWDVTRGRTDLTVNAGWNYVEATSTLAEVNRAELAGQLLLRLTEPSAVSGGAPLSVALAGSAGVEMDSAHDRVFRLQARMSLPLAEGITVPLSATWSNRRDQIAEDEIRGHVGFSFDLGQLTTALR